MSVPKYEDFIGSVQTGSQTNIGPYLKIHVPIYPCETEQALMDQGELRKQRSWRFSENRFLVVLQC